MTERALLGAAGIGLALFGGTFFVYFISELATGGDGKTRPAIYLGLIVMFAGMLAVGLFLAWRAFGPRPASAGQGRPGAAPTGGSPRARRAGPKQPSPAPAPSTPSPPSPPPPATDFDREQLILHLAEGNRGRLTVVEAASHGNITVAQAKATLDRLVGQQAAQIEITATGVGVYVFPGFLSDNEKADATDF